MQPASATKVDVPDGTAELTFVNGSEGGTYTTDNLGGGDRLSNHRRRI